MVLPPGDKVIVKQESLSSHGGGKGFERSKVMLF
jgi:hypothetical protein